MGSTPAQDAAAERLRQQIELRKFEERSRHAADEGRKAATRDYAKSAFQRK